MLTEKAQKEEDMKYPMDNLKNIVNFAFKGIENLEELSTPYRLVDEMLDHYKKEVIKYTLECYNYHPKNLDPLVR